MSSIEVTPGSDDVKDLKTEIKIVTDVEPGDVAEVRVDSSNDESSNNEPGPVEQVLQNISKSIQPIQKGFDENMQKFQGALDEHVKPHLDKAGAAVQGVQQRTSDSIKGISQNTQALMDEHVKPGLENFKQGTVQNFEASKTFIMDLPNSTRRVIDEKVIPAVENVKTKTQETARNVQESSIKSYQTHVEPHVHKVQEVHHTHESKYMGRAIALFDKHDTRFFMVWAEAILRAFGRVLFCDNPVSGAFIMFGMLLGSPLAFLCALLCVLSVTCCSYSFELVPLAELKSGMVGFNAVLVGAGTAVFLKFDTHWYGMFGSILFSAIILPPAILMTYLFCTRVWLTCIPPLLIPYNLVMIVFLVATILWDRNFVLSTSEIVHDDGSEYQVGVAALNAISTTYLVQGVASGVFMLLGAVFFSRILTAAMISGSILATLLGMLIQLPPVTFNAGIAGYNAVLTSAALAYYFEPSWTLVVVGVFVIILCELFQAASAAFFWDSLGLPINLTLGYCVATVVVLLLDQEESCSRLGVLSRIPDDHLTSPEEYLSSCFAPEDDDDDDDMAEESKPEETPEKEAVEVEDTPTESTPLISSNGMDV